jgi:hypothetical protein
MGIRLKFIRSAVWLNFGVRDLLRVLLRICELRAYRSMEGDRSGTMQQCDIGEYRMPW